MKRFWNWRKLKVTDHKFSSLNHDSAKKIKPSTLLSYIHIFQEQSKYYTIINITWIRLELDSDPLSKVLGLSLVDEKNVVERGDLTKGDRSSLPAEISHMRSWWILCTGNMLTKKISHIINHQS